MMQQSTPMHARPEYANETLQESQYGSAPQRNMGYPERLISKVGGVFLGAYGLTRGSLGGLLVAGVGGLLYHRGSTGICPVYSALDIDRSEPSPGPEIIRISDTVTINRSREDLYQFWRNFENLPLFMRHLAEVRQTDESHSHWRLRLASGLGSVEWDAELTEDRPGEQLSWRSLPGAELHNTGTVTFREAPVGRGTEVGLIIVYHPPGGRLGITAAKLANPLFAQMAREDIRRFKSLMEVGEIPTIEGQPTGS